MMVSQKTVKLLIAPAIMLAMLFAPVSLFAEVGPPDKIQEDKVELGKKVYFKRCVWCHGVEGAGDGPAADRLFTRPRNFNAGTFKIRTTDSGQLPMDQDLILSVKHGLSGSAMPAWGEFISDAEVQAVVQFVKKELVKDRNFNDAEEVVEIMDLGTNPWKTEGPYHLGIPQEAIDKGKEVFTKFKCWECHGGDGRGDGNPAMKDDWGFSIVAADWQQCWNFRGARRDPFNPFNIIRTMSTGLNGTPMPSFKEQIPLEDRWNVSAFVNSLCPRKKIDPLTNKPVPDFLIKAKYTEGKVSTDLNDPMWAAPFDDNRIKPRDKDYTGDQYRSYIAMAGQITRGNRNFKPKVDNIWVTARWSKEEQAVYYLVQYHNRFLSTKEEFPDGVAIQWPGKLQDLYGAEKPYFIYGDAKKPVDVWKASFLAKNYGPSRPPNDKGYELDMKVQELVGNGFDAVKVKESKPTVEVVSSNFTLGRANILFKRSLTTDNKETDIQIPTEKFIPISFMEWSGYNQEKNETMAISTWYYTILEPPTPDTIYYIPPIAFAAFLTFELWLVWMTRRTRSMYEAGKIK